MNNKCLFFISSLVIDAKKVLIEVGLYHQSGYQDVKKENYERFNDAGAVVMVL